MITITEFCARHRACPEGRAWARSNCRDMQQAWDTACPDWLIWIATRPGVLDDRMLRRFAAWSARQVQHLMADPRSTHALDVAERHADGLAADDELDAAGDAAGDAAWDAAGAAARAAGAAAGDAARAAWAAWAARAAARAAAWAAGDAAGAAAGDAARAAGAAAGDAARAAGAAARAAGAAAGAAAWDAARATQAFWLRANATPNWEGA